MQHANDAAQGEVAVGHVREGSRNRCHKNSEGHTSQWVRTAQVGSWPTRPVVTWALETECRVCLIAERATLQGTHVRHVTNFYARRAQYAEKLGDVS